MCLCLSQLLWIFICVCCPALPASLIPGTITGQSRGNYLRGALRPAPDSTFLGSTLPAALPAGLGREDGFPVLSRLPHPGEAALRNNAAIYTLKPR